jgi:hypothetical protein
LNCDGVTLKIGFIEYRIELYYQTSYESVKNLSYNFHHQSVLNAMILEHDKQLNTAQKHNIKSVVALMEDITEGFRLYITDIGTTFVKHVQFLHQAIKIRQKN